MGISKSLAELEARGLSGVSFAWDRLNVRKLMPDDLTFENNTEAALRGGLGTSLLRPLREPYHAIVHACEVSLQILSEWIKPMEML